MLPQVAMLGRRLLTFALLGAHVTRSAVLFQHSDELPETNEYDFIIAGGGTAGLVVATRLSENPKWNILVIEAGPSNEDVFATHPPGLSGELPNTRIDWNYTTIGQASLNGRNMGYSRAMVLGGCSSHNGMAYTRGSKDDWDRWSEITGNEGLSWDQMLPLMMKGERFTKDFENQPVNGRVDPSVHGHHGKLSVAVSPTDHPFNELILQATKELPDEFPFTLDMNGGRPIGIGWRQATMNHDAERSSSATAYLDTTGDNVHVLLNTFITRVLPIENGGTDFRGIEFTAGPHSPKRQLQAKKEVIVSGGVIGSPQILMNSGIGKREELEAVGVKTLVDNPGVGKNFSDQPMAFVMFDTKLPPTDYDRDAAVAEWNATRTGPVAHSGHLNHITWVRLSEDINLGSPDPTAGENTPHIEFSLVQISHKLPKMAVPIPLPPQDSVGVALQVSTINLHPVSRGSITLNSSDPFAHPLIDIGMLSEDVDIAVMREAIRSARRLYSAPVFKDSVNEIIFPTANITTDDDLNAYIRGQATGYLHGVGSASMSPRGASWGAVDPDFRVKGANGLRVVDASVIPSTPSGHTQAAVYGFAERASVMIADSWK